MVSFKNNTTGGKQIKTRRKKPFPMGLLIVLLLLVVVAGAFGVLKFWTNYLNETITLQEEKIKSEKDAMMKKMNGKSADFYQRTKVLENDIYKKHSSNVVLTKIEEIMVPRVVLLSFSHDVEKNNDEKISITADADEFEFMAQQVAKFKESDFFGNVRVNDVGRNKKSRIVFTIEADIVSKEDSMFMKKDDNSKENNTNQDSTVDASQTRTSNPVSSTENNNSQTNNNSEN
jgi:Tfp pilus assembly protein PilN